MDETKTMGTRTWYKTIRWDITITPVEVIRETDQCLFIEDKDWRNKLTIRQVRKDNSYGRHFSTLKEAQEHIANRLRRTIEAGEASLSKARSDLAKLEKEMAK